MAYNKKEKQKIVEYIKEGKDAKEVASLMGYKTYDGFKQALRRVYNTSFTCLYKEVTGGNLVRSKSLVPAYIIKMYVDCGVSVENISKMLDIGYDTVSRTFKREYSQTIREYKTKNGI